MIRIRSISSSSVSRFRNSALIALASLSASVMPMEDLRASWWSTPSKEKPAEDAEPKTASSAGDLIRKLTKDAKAQEAQGNLDQAISFADRALRLSERSVNSTKSEPDISPAATARYANDLRLKKAEQSVKRMGGSGKKPEGETASRIAQPQPRFKQPVAEINRPGSKKNAVDKNSAEKTVAEKNATGKDPDKSIQTADKSAVRKEAAKNPQPVAATVPKAAIKPKPPAGAETPKPVIAANETTKPLAKAGKPVVAPRKQDEFDEFPMPTRSVAAKPAPKAQAIAKERSDVKVASFDDDIAPQVREATPLVRPKPPQLTASRTPETKSAAASAPIKVRRQYTTNALAETLEPVETPQSKVAATEPAISSKESHRTVDDLSHEPRHIIPVAAEEEFVPSGKTTVDFDDDFDSALNESVDRRSRTHLPQDDFPFDKAREMKRRLETAAALEPGAVAPIGLSTLKEDSIEEPVSSSESTTQRGLKLKKRSVPFQRPSAAKVDAPADESARHDESTRQSVVGQTSMVKWRSAKDAVHVTERSAEANPKSSPLPDDLRQSVRESPDSTRISSASGTTDFSGDRPSPSRDWDWRSDDAGPPVDDYSTGSKKSTTTITFDMLPPTSAPLPPTEIADDHERQRISPASFDRRRHRESTSTADFSGNSGSMSIAPLSYSEDAVDSFVGANSTASTKLSDATTGPKETNASPKGRSFVGMMAATLLSLLSAAGVVAFIAGLWVLRVVIRSKVSQSE